MPRQSHYGLTGSLEHAGGVICPCERAGATASIISAVGRSNTSNQIKHMTRWKNLTPDQKLQRHVQSIGFFYYLQAATAILPGILLFASTSGQDVCAAFFLIVGGALLWLLGFHLRKFCTTARTFAYVVSVPLLLFIPLGTAIAIYSFCYLTKARHLFTGGARNGAAEQTCASCGAENNPDAVNCKCGRALPG